MRKSRPITQWLLIIAFLVTCQSQLKAQNFIKNFGGTTNEQGNAVAVDTEGNIYMTGKFTGTATFDTFSLTSKGSEDVFIVKISSVGNVIWAKGFGSTSIDEALSIKVVSNGNIYISGLYGGTINFGETQLAGKGGRDIFVAKFDTNGDVLWAKGYGGTGDDRSYAVSLDGQENVFIGGIISVTTANNAKIDFEGVEISSNGSYDMFLAKFDKNGNFNWVRSFGSTGDDRIQGLVANEAGNVYATGLIVGTVSFITPGKSEDLTSRGGEDAYVLKISSNGDLVWVKNFGGVNQEYGHGIDIDANGNVYSTGFFQTTANFHTGSGTSNLVTSGNRDIYITKLNSTGELVWVRQLSGGMDDRGLAVKVGEDGNIYAVGYTSQTSAASKFMAGTRPSTLFLDNTDQGENAYIAKLSAAGDFLWLKGLGGTASDRALALTTDASNKLYVTGYMGAATYDETEIITNGELDIFLMKINSVDGTLPVQLVDFTGTNKNAVNYIQWSTLLESNNYYFDIERSKDGINFYPFKRIQGSGNSNRKLNYAIIDNNPFIGNNYYRLKQVDFNNDFYYSNILQIKYAIDNEDVFVYPNPGDGKINVNNSKSIAFIKVFTMSGKLVLESLQKEIHKLDLASQPNGIYLINIGVGNQEKLIKYIKSENK